ncbi:MAG TPA: RodZ domain-containing protein [Thermaerobacter sp.]
MTLEEIGRLLRETREKKGLSLRDVQMATKIRLKYLEAIERGDERQLPPEVYAKGFIRAYANFLQLDGQELVRAYTEWKHRQEAARAAEDEPGTEDGRGQEEGTAPDAGEEPQAVPARREVRSREEPGARGGDVPIPSGPPLVAPFPGGHRRRGRRRREWPAPGYGSRWPGAGAWNRVAVVGLILLAVVAGILYYAGGPESAAERPQGPVAGSGQTGTGAPAGPDATSPGGAAETPGGTEEEPAQEPQAPNVVVERVGDEVRYEVHAGGAGTGPGDAVPVQLDATDDVWVRARDESGRVVFEKLMRSGDQEELALAGELRIRVGFPRGLQLRIGGQEVDVPDEDSPLNLIVRRAEF